MCLCMYVSMYVMFCHVLYVLYVYSMYIYIYVYIYLYVYLYVCVYIYICIFICASLYVCVGTHFCLYKSYLFVCLVDIQVATSWFHCYLGGILAFSFKIAKLNTTTCTKSSTQVIKINLGNMNSLFPTLIVNSSGCMYLFILINSD